MHETSNAWAELQVGQPLVRLRVTISPAANQRYWQAAGVEHALLAAGALYPPIVANLTILCFQQTVPDAMIQTRQRLKCHRIALAGCELVTTGRIVDRYDKRGREYVDLEASVTTADAPDSIVWESWVTFTPTATLAAS
ncbi:MAG: hypothetical protein ACLPVY_07835 [Acidimicrobiia bacterium]